MYFNHTHNQWKLLEGLELFDAVNLDGFFTEKRAMDVVYAVTVATQYLNDVLGVAHRDLKVLFFCITSSDEANFLNP